MGLSYRTVDWVGAFEFCLYYSVLMHVKAHGERDSVWVGWVRVGSSEYEWN